MKQVTSDGAEHPHYIDDSPECSDLVSVLKEVHSIDQSGYSKRTGSSFDKRVQYDRGPGLERKMGG